MNKERAFSEYPLWERSFFLVEFIAFFERRVGDV